MKTNLISAFILLASAVSGFAHGVVEIGPGGGRLIEFSSKDGLHAEVVLKDDKFKISLFDENTKKPVAIADKTLAVTTGDRNKPEKLAVEKSADGFVIPKPAGEDFWLILQIKGGAGGKAQTARLHYDAKPCPKCKKAEWLCSCKE